MRRKEYFWTIFFTENEGILQARVQTDLKCILTSTKNASLIITDFLVMIYKNEQPRTASLCRGWEMLENDFDLICRWRPFPMTSYRLKGHMTASCINRL